MAQSLPKEVLDLVSRSGLSELADKYVTHFWQILFWLAVILLAYFAYSRGSLLAFVWLRETLHGFRIPIVMLFVILYTLVVVAVVVPWSIKFLTAKVTIWEITPAIGVFVFGPIAGLTWYAVVLIGFVAVLGDRLATVRREWIAWLMGRWLLATLVGVCLSVIAFLLPYLVHIWPYSMMAFVTVTFSLIAITQVRESARTRFGVRWRRVGSAAFKILTYFWLLLVLALLSHYNTGLFARDMGGLTGAAYWSCLEQKLDRKIAVYWLAVGLAGLLASARTGNNRFSMHAFYRRKIIACYLRPASPETDRMDARFGSEDDDLPLSTLATGYASPYPLYIASMNMMAGDELSWQQRKACSFVFSPLFCGFSPRSIAASNRLAEGAYLPTRTYPPDQRRGISLGHAMAISGAALSPQMGYQSWRPFTFLSGLLNLRLGWWLPNPWVIHRAPRVPTHSVLTVARELLGLTDDLAENVYVSDGGHFENLGIYELVKRSCRVIVSIDASEDRLFRCHGLANAVEKCRVDFGIDIKFGPDGLSLSDGTRGWVLARICYQSAGRGPDGALLYIKAARVPGVPLDVQAYAQRHPSFPHESTNNQWFSETQFESYRALGAHIVSETFAWLKSGADDKELATLVLHGLGGG